jgi:hypothetical protein
LLLVAITMFDVILMLRESVHGLVDAGSTKTHLFRAMTLRDFRKVLEPCGKATGATNLGSPC